MANQLLNSIGWIIGNDGLRASIYTGRNTWNERNGRVRYARTPVKVTGDTSKFISIGFC